MLGGAEKSTFEILKQESVNSVDIELISFDGIRTFRAENKKNEFPKNWILNYINGTILFNRFFYWEYLINRTAVKSYFNSLENNSVLYTYAIYAPIAIIGFNGKSKLFIRSESDLAINKNYHKGMKKYLKYIYMVLEYPAFYIYKKDLEKAIEDAEVVCNSKYMSHKLKELYGIKSEVLYPYVDEVRLKNEYVEVRGEIKEKGIVFVGDAIIKGIELAKKISTKMPNESFYFFSRYVDEPKTDNNITWMPWQQREVDIYKYAKVVIAPSIWEEAYGRVSREAFLLNIPVLVSNRGGLPETVDGKQDYIVEDYLNPEIWKKKIESFL